MAISTEEALRQLREQLKDSLGSTGIGVDSVPETDPTYRSGYEYARSIAGGMPFEQVVAPGLQFGPEFPMGVTQETLDRMRMLSGSDQLAMQMPSAPSTGQPLSIEDQMPYAPAGTPEPTIFGQQPTTGQPFAFTNIFEQFLPDTELADLELREKLAELEKENDTGAVEDVLVGQAPQPGTMAPVMPSAPASVPSQFIPSIPGIPTPLPMPITQPTPQAQPMPMPVFTPPSVPSLLGMPQVRTEEIVSPIVTGSRRFVPPSLINLV